MALMTCPDCSNQYPDDAPYCPNCGRPNPARQAGAAGTGSTPGGGQPETPAGTGPGSTTYTAGTGSPAGSTGGAAGSAGAAGSGSAYGAGTGSTGSTGGTGGGYAGTPNETPAGGGYAPGGGYGGAGGAGGAGYGGGGYGGGAPAGGSPPQAIPNYLVHAILVTLCCCLPFGIVSIVYATQVNTKRDMGDIAGALVASNNAKKWAMIGAGVGVVWIIIIIAFNGLALLAGLASSANGG
jgi:hypothetical protein